ncbi:MAG: hypothetical protein AAGN35_21860 [Bacteroidota bacterium]
MKTYRNPTKTNSHWPDWYREQNLKQANHPESETAKGPPSSSESTSGIRDGNDYFNENGQYLYTDCGGKNEIRIIDSTTFDQITALHSQTYGPNGICLADDVTELDKYLYAASRNLTATDFREGPGDHLLGGIGRYYLRKEGKSDIPVGMGSSMGSAAFTTIEENRRIVNVSTNFGDLTDSNLAWNKYQMINTLIHEAGHFERHYEVAKNAEGEDTYQSRGTDASVPGGSGRHLEAYWDQVNHWSWQRVDRESQEYDLQVIAMHIAYLSLEDRAKATDWVHKFEEKCGIVFRKMTSRKTENVIEWK